MSTSMVRMSTHELQLTVDSNSGALDAYSSYNNQINIDINPSVISMIAGLYVREEMRKLYSDAQRSRISDMVNNSMTRDVGLALIENMELRFLIQSLFNHDYHSVINSFNRITSNGYIVFL